MHGQNFLTTINLVSSLLGVVVFIAVRSEELVVHSEYYTSDRVHDLPGNDDVLATSRIWYGAKRLRQQNFFLFKTY